MNFSFDLKKYPGRPIYRALAGELIACIESGRLKPGDKLPPSRELADSLGISRYTVKRTYDELISANYLETHATSGTFVSAGALSGARASREKVPLVIKSTSPGAISDYSKRLQALENLRPNPEYLGALNFGAPPANLLPHRVWRQLLQKHVEADQVPVYQPDVSGRVELRRALCRFLARNNGIECHEDQIFVFMQSQGMLNLLCRMLFNEGDRLAVEEPGFGAVRNIAHSLGLTIAPVAVNQDGIDADALWGLPSTVRAVYVTPAHHDPTGAVMSLKQRQSLLAWAKARGAWVFEDDFDNFFNYGTRALPSLVTMAGGGSVIYCGTFWKLMYPLSTLAFAVLPPSLCELMCTAKTLAEPNHVAVEQFALADYIDEGHLERRIRRIRNIYTERRRTLIYHLKRVFADQITIDKRSPGSHLLVRLPLPLSESDLCAAAAKANLGIVSTSNHYMTEGRPKHEFLIDFSQQIPESTEACIEKFKKLVRV